jgi:multicomponent Na+:H+ antiporter subunit G
VNPISSALILVGAVLAVLAGIGLLRFNSAAARFHSAGKASPIAFMFVAIGAAPEVGLFGAAQLAVAAVALVLTLPAATHLLFRATHRTSSSAYLRNDALTRDRISQASKETQP